MPTCDGSCEVTRYITARKMGGGQGWPCLFPLVHRIVLLKRPPNFRDKSRQDTHYQHSDRECDTPILICANTIDCLETESEAFATWTNTKYKDQNFRGRSQSKDLSNIDWHINHHLFCTPFGEGRWTLLQGVQLISGGITFPS